jgi:hypothetical protein
MKLQEYYDQLYEAAYNGTFPSVDEQGDCQYRGPGGKRCAVGLLIPAEAYRPGLEGVVVRHFFEEADVLDMPEGFDLYDLLSVQGCHDATATRTCGWRAGDFVKKINRLDCFHNVIKRTPGKAEAPAGACVVTHPGEGDSEGATEEG